MGDNNLLMIVLAFIFGYMLQGMMKNMCGGRLIEGSFWGNVRKDEYHVGVAFGDKKIQNQNIPTMNYDSGDPPSWEYCGDSNNTAGGRTANKRCAASNNDPSNKALTKCGSALIQAKGEDGLPCSNASHCKRWIGKNDDDDDDIYTCNNPECNQPDLLGVGACKVSEYEFTN